MFNARNSQLEENTVIQLKARSLKKLTVPNSKLVQLFISWKLSGKLSRKNRPNIQECFWLF